MAAPKLPTTATARIQVEKAGSRGTECVEPGDSLKAADLEKAGLKPLDDAQLARLAALGVAE